MISTYYRRSSSTTPSALFDPTVPSIDPLTKTFPSWRIDDEPTPIYLGTVQHLGIPGLDDPASPGDVIEGTVLDGPPTVVLSLPATRPLPVLTQEKRTRNRRSRRQRQQRRNAS